MIKKALVLFTILFCIAGAYLVVDSVNKGVSESVSKTQGFAPISLRDPLVEERFRKDLSSCEEESKISTNPDCFYNAMKVAMSGTSPIGVFDIINSLIEKGNLYVTRECHVAGHKIGADWVLNGSDPLEAVKVEEIRCEGAFTHGVLDAWALTKPSLDDASDMADVCDYQVGQSYEDSYKKTWCWDGLGHAGWVASGENYLDSLKRCAFIDSAEGRSYCVEGVFMEIYEPANYERGRGLGRVAAELPLICEKHPMDWLPTGASEDPRQGCWQGAGYLLTRLVTWDLDPSEGEALIRARIDRLISLCATMGDGKEVCEDRLKTASAPNFGYNAGALSYGCSLYRDPAACEDAVKSEFAGISRDFQAEVVVARSKAIESVDYKSYEWRKPPMLGKDGVISNSVLDQL